MREEQPVQPIDAGPISLDAQLEMRRLLRKMYFDGDHWVGPMAMVIQSLTPEEQQAVRAKDEAGINA